MKKIIFSLLLLFWVSSTFPRQKFSFLNYTHLRQGQSYEVHAEVPIAGKTIIGHGKVIALSHDFFHLQSTLDYAHIKTENHFKLTYLGMTNGDYQLQVSVSDDLKMRHSALNAKVISDSFVADNGMLAFYTVEKGKKLFFQLSAKVAGVSKVVTDYGQVRLLAKP